MHARSLAPSLLITSMLLASSIAPIAAQDSGITFKVTELATGLYMLEGEGGFSGGNLGLLVGEDGVVLIDDGLPPLSDTLLAAIGKLTDKSVDFVVNTHVHGDHIGANEVFGKRGATIVAHDNLRKRLVTDGMQGPTGKVPAPKAALPVLTFADSVTIHLNDQPAFVFHVATAHTDGDAIIHFLDADVIHAGDVMFNGLFPFIDIDSGGTVEGYIAAQRRILEVAGENTKIIPGHGPVASRADLEAAVSMLVDSNARVRALVEAGESDEAILALNPLADYHEGWNWMFITTERMTQTLIRSAREARPVAVE